MRKLSKAQERVLRQVADGKVKLVYVGDNDHSVRVWNAADKNGKNINPTYDVLIRMDLICSPYIVRQEDNTRKVFLTVDGENTIKKMGPAGKLVYTDYQLVSGGTGHTWMIRKEEDADLPYVLYKDGQVYDRFARPQSVYTVFRSFCPHTGESVEASLSR